jgi:hypothetical protein
MINEILADNPNYRDRISGGRRIETNILNQLREKGLTIENPKDSEDKYDKIDGWLINKNSNVKYAIQIKFRETGDDIIFELVKDLDKKIEGRDLISKASVYIVSDRNGKTRMLLTKEIKDKANQLLSVINSDLEKNPDKTFWHGNGYQVRIQTDRAHGQRKMVAYFTPNLFTIHATWDLNIQESVLKYYIKKIIIKEFKLLVDNKTILK